jgi:hypothetical protein
MRRTGRLLLAAMLTIGAGLAYGQTVLDDFSSTPYTNTVLSGVTDSHHETVSSVGVSAIRTTTFLTFPNPSNAGSKLDISGGGMIVDVPFQGLSGLDASYDYRASTGSGGVSLTGFHKFQIEFQAVAAGYGVDLSLNILIYRHDGRVYQASKSIGPSFYPVMVEVLFDQFVSNQGTHPDDLSQVDFVVFLFHALDSFGVRSIKVAP